MSFRSAYAAQGFTAPGRSLPLSFFYIQPSRQLYLNTLTVLKPSESTKGISFELALQV